MCQTVDEECGRAEMLWQQAERQRYLQRGYTPALAEFWVLCARAGYVERHLARLGLHMATIRRLRYLEMPAWEEVAPAARRLCRDEAEYQHLQSLWAHDEREQKPQRSRDFGSSLQKMRKQKGVSRRELADLFGIGGKKPARIIKYIEEDGFFSAQAYPAGLTALLTTDAAEQARLLQLWQARRRQFHRRHRPETRIDLRLAREVFGFELKDMEPILGYSNLEYQRIERGVTPLLDSAHERILQAIHQAGRRRVEELLRQRRAQEAERVAWQTPHLVTALVTLLARREGGMIPLARLLRRSGVKGLWTERLRAIAQGREIPAWPVLGQIGQVCGVEDLHGVRLDWIHRYRAELQRQLASPLGVELRLLIAETATTLRAFSPRLGFNYSVLIRDLQRIDREEPIKWYHIERILRAAGVTADGERWREIRGLWYTAAERRRSATVPEQPRRRRTSVLEIRSRRT
jgi:transcriptional regulator with XRE-family HTH domain